MLLWKDIWYQLVLVENLVIGTSKYWYCHIFIGSGTFRDQPGMIFPPGLELGTSFQTRQGHDQHCPYDNP